MGSRLRLARAIGSALALAGPPLRADELALVPIPVVVQVPAKTYYAGQGIELRVGAEAGGERPEVDPPQIPHTDVSLIGAELSPMSATGIGNLTSERNLFVTRFRLITHQTGPLRIPPVRARLGMRTGVSRSLMIMVESPPLVGRPAEFLGGVGAFAVAGEASPSTLRAGQDLTYTIHVTGPAARGMQNVPGLARFSQVPLGLQVEPLPPVVENSPPSRRFRYRIRATRPGTAALPPVAVAAFDPQTARYVTRVTASIPIRVVDVPKFDPATLAYLRPPERESPTPLASGARMAAGLTLATAVLVVMTLVARSFRRRSRIDPGRWLLRRARGLDPRREAGRVAREITETLAEYFDLRIGRPRGVLTPEEARSAIAGMTLDQDLAARCARLVSDCDRVSYSLGAPGTHGAELVDEARRVYKEIGKKGTAGIRRGELGTGVEKTRERQP